MSDDGFDDYRRFWEDQGLGAEDNQELRDRFLDNLPQFVALTMMQLAYLHYRWNTQGELPPSGRTPQELRAAHQHGLAVTELVMRPYAQFFGVERWPTVWRGLASFLSGPTEVIIRYAEEQERRQGQ